MKQVQYAVWQNGDDEQFWNLYDTKEQAVDDNGDGCEVYRMEAKLLGRFKNAVKTIRIKRRKKRKS